MSCYDLTASSKISVLISKEHLYKDNMINDLFIFYLGNSCVTDFSILILLKIKIILIEQTIFSCFLIHKGHHSE